MKKTMINVFCSLLVLVINVLISFFLSPYIVKNIGVEANGFVTLANNFVMYAELIVTALNSMASRFIAIAYVKKDYKTANLYYNSVFWGNLIIVAILLIPSLFLLYRLDMLVNVPSNLVFDVKLLFLFIFFNFFIGTGLPNWECGAFIANRLDRAYIAQMIVAFVRCSFLFLVFLLLPAKVYYVGIAATLMTLITITANYINTHQLTPELKISFKKILCSWEYIKELVGSGIWNSICRIGNILLTGIDLIICNLYLGATDMGVVSLTKMIPNYLEQLSSSVTGAFTPELTINYANGDNEKLLKDINRSMKLSSVILTIPVAIFVVMGDSFFSLWVPSQNARLLQILAILASLKFVFISGVQILYNVFPTVNKVKGNAISQIITGICSILITVILVKYSKYGIYAVAGISSICDIVKNIVYVIPICAKYLGLKWNIFYKQVLITVLSSVSLIIVGLFVRRFIDVNSWLQLIVVCFILSVVGLIMNIFITLNKKERLYFKDVVFRKLHLAK